MKRGAARYAAFAAALALAWLVLLLGVAGVDPRTPLSPANERAFPGSRFHAVFGKAAPEAQHLQVNAPAADFSLLQSTALPDLEAADFPILHYRFEDFPATLELSLVFRTRDAPDDVQTISLPAPVRGAGTFDLSRVPQWKGRVVELGFAEFATAQIVPADLGFRPFELVKAELWSRSWRGALAVLATDWSGVWPWSQRSVHSLGREGDARREGSAVTVAALAALVAVALAAALLGLRGRGLLAFSASFALLAWIVLDLDWQVLLRERLRTTQALYAGLDWTQRARIVGDSDILHAADEVRLLLQAEPPGTRVLVEAGTGYQRLRLIWHLLPLNVAELPEAMAARTALPDDSLIVFYDTDAWHANPAVRRLLASGGARFGGPDVLHADGFEPAGKLVVFRYRHAR